MGELGPYEPDTIVHGHVLEVLRQLPDESIHCCITSPPYWGLRAYGTQLQVWGGDSECRHVWGLEQANICQTAGLTDKQMTNRGSYHGGGTNSFCSLCGAWRGELGLEPSPEQFVQHLVEIFREVRRVLRQDGTLWLNLGQSYWGGKGQSNYAFQERRESPSIEGKQHNITSMGETRPSDGSHAVFKPKDLVPIPWMVAMALQQDGWWLRSSIIWCLAGETPLLCRVDGRIWHGTIEELQRRWAEWQTVEMPTMGKGYSRHWVKVRSVVQTGVREVKRITLTNGAEVLATGDHKFPVRKSTLAGRTLKWMNAPVSVPVSDLSPGMYLYQNTQIESGLPEGTVQDYKNGYWVGFYLAEGYRVSTNYETLRLACGTQDREIINRLISWGIPLTVIEREGERLTINLRIRHGGAAWRDVILSHITGRSAATKKLKQDVFNRSLLFLEGLLYGFLDGDGTWDEAGRRWRVGMTAKNKTLVNQFEAICRILGLEFRRERIKDVGAFGKVHKAVRFNIINLAANYRGKGKIVVEDTVTRRIRSIDPAGSRSVYDLELEPLYGGERANQWVPSSGETSDARKVPYNHLYFLGNGIWTHNCKGSSFATHQAECPHCNHKFETQYSGSCMPESVKDRPTQSYEYVFLLAKDKRYFYDQEAVREPHSRDWSRESWAQQVNYGTKTQSSLGQLHGGNKTIAETYNPSGRNLRSVWTINPHPFNDWIQTVRLVRVGLDGVSDGMMHITSPSCPVHGCLGRPDDGRGEDGQSHISRTDGCPDPEPESLLAYSSTRPLLPKPGCSSGSQVHQCSHAAIGHSNQNHRTDRARLTSPSCRLCAQSSCRIGDKQELLVCAVLHENMPDCNTWPDEMGARLLDRIPYHIVDKSSYLPPSCTCGFYHKVTKESSHFATYPPELITPMILAGTSARGVCPKCGSPWERVVKGTGNMVQQHWAPGTQEKIDTAQGKHGNSSVFNTGYIEQRTTTGWQPTCSCGHEDTVPAIVLDPFMGSGTTAMVALENRRQFLGIELNPEYVAMAENRIAAVQPRML